MPKLDPLTFNGRPFDSWMSSHYYYGEEPRQIVHLFGEMDLPLEGTVELAFQVAENAAECCGYIATRSGDSIDCYGRDGEAYRVTYREGRIHSIICLEEEAYDEGPIDAAADSGLWNEDADCDF